MPKVCTTPTLETCRDILPRTHTARVVVELWLRDEVTWSAVYTFVRGAVWTAGIAWPGSGEHKVARQRRHERDKRKISFFHRWRGACRNA
jgi:hypothetical protein